MVRDCQHRWRDVVGHYLCLMVHEPFDETSRCKHTNTFLTHPTVNQMVTWFWIWQNHHSVHHLFLRIPFYQYDKVFDRIESGMREREAPIIQLI